MSTVGRLMHAHRAFFHDHKLEEFAGIEIALTLVVVLTIVFLMANGYLTYAH
jgi:hypothetical protein